MPHAVAPTNIAARFVGHARANPDRPALVYPDRSVTYGSLDQLRRSVMDALYRSGVRPRHVVCISNAKSPLGYAAMLACLSLGASYVNIDPENPAARLEAILDTAKPVMAAIDGAIPEPLAQALDGRGIARLDLAAATTAGSGAGLASDTVPEELAFTGSFPAYVMFTSGSTGVPKGAAISHDNLGPFVDWIGARFAVRPNDVFTGVNPVYFDNSVFDFYGALCHGASLAPCDQELMRRPKQLVEWLDVSGATIWFSVPSLLVYLSALKLLDGKALRSIRRFIFGGEGFPKAILKTLHDRYHQTARLVNVYGPTECTCICSAHDILPQDFADMRALAPLGRLNPNFDGLVLRDGQPAKPGEVGELCLLGPGVGLGYLTDPERTAASFTTSPVNAAWPERMYRTGDLVARDADGTLWFRGRADHQIKHMGYRIELEEIEAALNGIPSVAQAAVVYHREDPARPGRIIAYVSPRETFDLDELRVGLKERLPHYMRPYRIEEMETLPKNANGKVDRLALSRRAADGVPA